MKKYITACILPLLFAAHDSIATNYYLSNSGNDANNGTTPSSPWQTINHLNTAGLQPGDSVLFQSANVFHGQVIVTNGGSETAPVYFGIYGGSAAAVISAAELVTGWSLFSGSVYQTSFSETPYLLFAGDELMVPARFPNSGYLFHQQGFGTAGFIDAGLTQPDHYWDGAGIRMRTTNRLYEYNLVDHFRNDSVYFTDNSQAIIENGYGYFFDNLLSELDTAGEWYYDSGQQLLYFYAPGGNDPNGLAVEASLYEDGIQILNGAGYTIIDHLNFEKQYGSAIHATGFSTGITVVNCTFSNQGSIGISLMQGAAACEIAGNAFYNISGAAISAGQLSNSIITKNAISKTGMLAGYGTNTLQQGMGISIDGGNVVTVSANTIDSTGNSSININGFHTVVEKNVCSNSLLHFNQSGAIYSYGSNSDSVIIRNNIIQTTLGSSEATPDPLINTAGIFLDEQTQNYLVEKNSIAFSECNGIMLNRGGTGHFIHQNTVFGCKNNQLYFEEGSQGANNGHLVTGNIFYALHEDAAVVALQSYFPDFEPALFDSNYYFNPYDFFAFRKITLAGNEKSVRFFTLQQWREYEGGDAASKATYFFRNRFHVTDTLENNLVTNGNFTANTDGWNNATPDNLQVLLDNSTPLDNGCMKLLISSNQFLPYGETYCGGISADSGSYYQMGFSCYSVREGNTGLIQKQNGADYLPLDLNRFFPFGADRRDYNVVFAVDAPEANCNLYANLPVVDSVVWLDNISWRKVNAYYENPLSKSRLFLNPAEEPKVFDLLDSVFYDLDQNVVTGSLTVSPYSSRILVYDSALITHVETVLHHQEETPAIHIYPSLAPAGETIRITGNVTWKAGSTITILNARGMPVLVKKTATNWQTQTLQLPATVNAGIYIVMVQEKTLLLTQKIIVR